ncbi:unnamed protein product, partial [Hapterophycus canaliculatus]
GESASEVKAEGPTAEDWTRRREGETRKHERSSEQSSAAVEFDGEGCFPFLLRQGVRDGVDHSEDTDSSTSDNVWFACSNNFFKPTRRRTNSFRAAESNDRDGGGGRGRCPVSPLSRLRKAAVEAVARQLVAAAGGCGGGGSLHSACRVTLRCAGSGDALSSRIHDFLASERKVFLMIGEAGSGKSVFVASLAQELALSYSQRHEDERVADGAGIAAQSGGGERGAAAGRIGGFLPVMFDARASEGEQGVPLDRIVEHYLTTYLG